MRLKTRLHTALLALSLGFLACTQDAYDKGQGTYSLMRVDLVEAHVRADSLIDYVTTDDGQLLQLLQPSRHTWVKTTDTLYRAMLYYNLSGQDKAEVLSCAPVITTKVTPADSLKEGMKTDPVGLESVWMARSRRYLNVSIYLKMGESDNDKAVHRLAIVKDTLVENADATSTLCLQLYHDQGNVPAYYSQRTYFSIPLYDLQADSVSLTVTTYDGRVTKLFATKQGNN